MSQLNNSKLSYRRLFQIILSRWYWVLAAVVISLLTAYIKLSYTPFTYSTEATLKFDERRSEISELINVRNIYDRNNKLQSEQFVIRSREVLSNAIKRLHYDVSFYKVGYFNTEEMYPRVPFKIIVLQQPSTSKIIYKLTPEGSRQFILEYEKEGEIIRQTCTTAKAITLGNLRFMISGNFKDEVLQHTYVIRFNRPEDFLSRVNDGLTILENKNTNVLTFKQVDPNPVFAADVLNAVLQEYVDYDKNQKTQSATQTIAFIDTLLLRLSKVVGITGSNFQKFKSQTSMLNVSGASAQAVEKLDALEKQAADLELDKLRILQLERDIQRGKEQDIITFNAQDIRDPYLSNLLTQYNALLLKKQAQLSTYKASSETIRDSDVQLKIIKQTLIDNVSGQKLKNQEALGYLAKQLAMHRSTIQAIPASERDFVNLQSEFDVNQKVYAYLNQKKLEAQISKASIMPSAMIVNKAVYDFQPIAPIKINMYKAALLLGICLGIGLIFMVRLINPYIYERETIEQLTTTPLIGIIRQHAGKRPAYCNIYLEGDSKTMFAESLRAIRTSISFLAPDVAHKMICISSETSGEGKSFIAMHLAQMLAMIDKRVIVVTADLRKSKANHVFSASNVEGLSNYLSGQTDLDSIINRSADHVAFISGGPVPPNPSELLYSQKMEDMIAVLKERFDYIIIDSAPIGLVSDAIPIIRQADINLFIIRAGLSRYHAANVPMRLSKELQINNFHIILNAYNHDTLHSPYYTYANYDLGYPYPALAGYDQGYFDHADKRKWWAFRRNR